nr:hypothetical protein [uncultured Flavobacterium sp.]
MKKLVIIALLAIGTSSNAQDLIIGENINDGTIVNIITGEEIANNNCICVEINSKTSTIEITTFDKVKKYHIDTVEFNGDGYNDYFCSNDHGQKIEVSTIGFSISVKYNDYLISFADYPLYIQMLHSDKMDKLTQETNTLR